MKRIFTILILVSTIACSKSKKDCYWTVNGNDQDHYPTQSEIAKMEQDCSCTVVIEEHCD